MTTNCMPLVSYSYEIMAILAMKLCNPLTSSAFLWVILMKKKNNVKLNILEDTPATQAYFGRGFFLLSGKKRDI